MMQDMYGNRAVPKVIEKTMTNAFAQLKAAGCSFRVVDLLGNEVVYDPSNRLSARGGPVMPQRRRRSSLRPFGQLSNYFKPYINDMKPGDLVNVPCGDYDIESLRSALSAHMCTRWGSGSYTTSINKIAECIEVLRIK